MERLNNVNIYIRNKKNIILIVEKYVDPFFKDFLTVVYYPDRVIIRLHDYDYMTMQYLTLTHLPSLNT